MNKTLTTAFTPRENRRGFGYLVFQILFLPTILTVANVKFHWRLNEAELNFVFFFVNFLAILWIFHGFLGKSAGTVLRHPAYVCQAVVLGLAAYFACSLAVEWLIGLLLPGFSNANDSFIASMSRGNFLLMALGTVVLVPPVEECLYRGLIFRNLYGKSRWAAYLVSMAAFTAIHIMGYLGQYSPVELCFAVLQYLPAGLCLAWAYTKADTIFAPIAMHAIINAVGLYRVR